MSYKETEFIRNVHGEKDESSNNKAGDYYQLR